MKLCQDSFISHVVLDVFKVDYENTKKTSFDVNMMSVVSILKTFNTASSTSVSLINQIEQRIGRDGVSKRGQEQVFFLTIGTS